MALRYSEIPVELAEQGIAISLGPIGEVSDEVLNLGAGGFTETLHATEIDGIGLYELAIELVLADELAEAIADPRTSSPAVTVRRLGMFSRLGGPFADIAMCAQFLDRADSDAIGLAKSTIHCTGFSYPHFGATHEGSHI